jgi:hypothetical protein
MYFKAFLSHRFGSRCPKSRIFQDEYNLIKNEMTVVDGQLLDSFYELDDNNTINKEYKLKNTKTIIDEKKVGNKFFFN